MSASETADDVVESPPLRAAERIRAAGKTAALISGTTFRGFDAIYGEGLDAFLSQFDPIGALDAEARREEFRAGWDAQTEALEEGELRTDGGRDEWTVEQRGLDGEIARGQTTLGGGVAKDGGDA